tara:strand:+ start:49 stop:489 length:441 start_codon:yes stop_codon:yes gene_type:complete
VASSTFPNDQPINTPKPKRQMRFVARSSAQQVQERSQRLYSRQLEGKTTRALVLEHAKIESISEVTAWQDWKKVKEWNKEDWEKDRENLLPRLQAMRIRLFNKAVKKGQLQTAAQILDSLGKVIGESVETVNIQAPELSIRVEPKN